MKLQRIFILIIALGLMFSTGQVAYAHPQTQQAGDSRYFDETGHWVTGDFYNYYTSFEEPEFVFGYPITEAFSDPRTGRVIQYFQKARFEFYPDRIEGSKVEAIALGRAIYQAGPSLNLSNLLSCRTYSQTGFSVCYAFLDFFDKYGGLSVFGYPISGFEIYNGRIVQYFERARFEWYPELPEGQKVVLASLGRIYFDRIGEDPALLNPVINSFAPSAVLELKTRLFTWKPVARSGDAQKVYVVVQDQALRPVPDAIGMLTIEWPTGTETQRFVTDKNGVAVLDLKVTGQPYGKLVNLTADVVFSGLNGHAVTSFRIWR